MTKHKKGPILCTDKDCTGCSACFNSCRKEAINMEYNSEGYYNPVVDLEKCVGCLQCEKACPVLNPLECGSSSPSAFYGWSKDSDVRNYSSSGGVFSELARIVLHQGGVVWGAGFSNHMQLEYICADTFNALDKIRRSKYIQARVGSCYQIIKEQLKTKLVLFCGTPYHVAGLYAYLHAKPENLLTVDFVCHGVPPHQLWDKYVGWLENKYGETLVDFNFRDKKFGVNYNVGTSATFEKSGSRSLYLKDNGYTLAFCKDKIIHQACQKCVFRSCKRHSDITISDYHIRKRACTGDELYKGASCIIVNSAKGNDALNKCNLHLSSVNMQDIIDGNPSYTKSNMQSIFCYVGNSDFADFMNKHLRLSMRDIIKTIVTRIFGAKLLYKIFK